MSDTSSLVAEARQVWQVFEGEVEKQKLSAAILTPTQTADAGELRLTKTFGLIATKDSSGVWYLRQ